MVFEEETLNVHFVVVFHINLQLFIIKLFQEKAMFLVPQQKRDFLLDFFMIKDVDTQII